MTAFGADVLRLTVDLLPLLLAFPLARLVRSPAHAALVVMNLWLFMELLTSLVDPGYRFGALLLARLVASGLQIGIACGTLVLWRQWRDRSESVTVH
ncbi:MAG: hypothetical protein ACREGK_07275 [Geminicoccales bacterium]